MFLTYLDHKIDRRTFLVVPGHPWWTSVIFPCVCCVNSVEEKNLLKGIFFLKKNEARLGSVVVAAAAAVLAGI